MDDETRLLLTLSLQRMLLDVKALMTKTQDANHLYGQLLYIQELVRSARKL